MINVRVEAVEVILNVEAVRIANGSAVFDIGVISDDFCHAVIVVNTSAWVCHTYYIIAGKLG